VVKAAAVAAAENHTDHRFQFTAKTGQKWGHIGNVTGFEVDRTQSFVTRATGEAVELGMQEKDIVNAIIVQAKPPPAAPTWQVLSPDLRSLERNLTKMSGEDGWTSGVVSNEVVRHDTKRGGVAWNVDINFDLPVATKQLQNSNQGGEEYFRVRHQNNSVSFVLRYRLIFCTPAGPLGRHWRRNKSSVFQADGRIPYYCKIRGQHREKIWSQKRLHFNSNQ
jgi:hypothetical protein